jgi:hypothetical protein
LIPTQGDVFALFVERLRAYVTVQVTAVEVRDKDRLAAVVALDWVGAEPPSRDQLSGLRPQVFDFLFWDADVEHLWVPARVPRGYRYIGTSEPVLSGDLHNYGGWPTGRRMWAQRRWERIPQDVRDRFKAALRDNDRTIVMEIAGRKLTRALRGLDAARLNAVADHARFDGFPLLTDVSTDRPVPGLFHFLRRQRLIYKAELRSHGERVVDLRGTHLTDLILDVTGVEEVHLNDDLEDLSLVGAPEPGLRVHAEDDGRWLSLSLPDGMPTPWAGLDALRSLSIHQAREVDAQTIARRFPNLTDLRIWGAPGYLRQVAGLSELPLATLMLKDVFGYRAEEFPTGLPELETLWLTSIPADVAAAVKTAYRGKPDLDLDVRQPRKPEWLAANVDNPFRDWDGSDRITAAQAKKAATLYRTSHTAALKATTVTELTEIATTFVEGFNKLDSGFVDTMARDQIMDALGTILGAVETKAQITMSTTDRTAVFNAADSIRDF